MFGLSPKKLIIFLFLAVGLFVAVQYGRAFFTRFQFNDAIRQSVKYASSSRKGPDDVRREVLNKAEELGIDIGPRDVHITKRGPAFQLEVEYEWPVNLQVYRQILTFKISEDGEMFGQ